MQRDQTGGNKIRQACAKYTKMLRICTRQQHVPETHTERRWKSFQMKLLCWARCGRSGASSHFPVVCHLVSALLHPPASDPGIDLSTPSWRMPQFLKCFSRREEREERRLPEALWAQTLSLWKKSFFIADVIKTWRTAGMCKPCAETGVPFIFQFVACYWLR